MPNSIKLTTLTIFDLFFFRRFKILVYNDLLLINNVIGINQGIFIEFLGKAYCQWSEGTGNKKETHTGTEIYLEERHYFVGGRTGETFLL